MFLCVHEEQITSNIRAKNATDGFWTHTSHCFNLLEHFVKFRDKAVPEPLLCRASSSDGQEQRERPPPWGLRTALLCHNRLLNTELRSVNKPGGLRFLNHWGLHHALHSWRQLLYTFPDELLIS